MLDVLDRPSAEFCDAAAIAATRQSVTIELDDDVLKFIHDQGLNITEHLNGLARFYMDTSQQLERNADPDAWEPGEMIPAEPSI